MRLPKTKSDKNRYSVVRRWGNGKRIVREGISVPPGGQFARIS